MTQVEIAKLLEEALEREGVKNANWSVSSDPELENGGIDVREDIELRYLGTPGESEKFSLLHPRTLGATGAALQRETFIEAVCKKIRAIKLRVTRED